MSITYRKGDLLKSEASVLVIPVNTVGVMGAGLARAYKNNYPQGFLSYKSQCDNRTLTPRAPGAFSNYRNGIPRWHVFLATKEHWSQASQLAWITGGCQGLVKMLPKFADRWSAYSEQPLTVAIPRLGCGLGGLEWSLVHQVILDELQCLQNTRVQICIYGEKP